MTPENRTIGGVDKADHNESKPMAALAECLRREAALHRQMLEAMLRQREHLMRNDVTSIESGIALEEKLLRQLSNAHKRSDMLFAHLAAQYDLSESASISDLLEAAPDSARVALAAARDELCAIVEDVHRENSTNAALLASAVEYVSFCMRLFGNHEPDLAYNPNGLKNSKASNLAVDVRV